MTGTRSLRLIIVALRNRQKSEINKQRNKKYIICLDLLNLFLVFFFNRKNVNGRRSELGAKLPVNVCQIEVLAITSAYFRSS